MVLFFSILFALAIFVLVTVVLLLSRYHLGRLRRGSFAISLFATLFTSFSTALLVFFVIPLVIRGPWAHPIQLFLVGMTIGSMPIVPAATIQWFNEAKGDQSA